MSGEAVAGSRSALAQELLAKGQILVEARPAGSGFGILPGLRRQRVGLSALIGFLRELRSLVGAGIPLARAFRLLENGRDAPALSAAIRDVRVRIGEGAAPDEAMASHPEAFDALICATVRAGVASGKLDAAIDHLMEFLELRRALERKVKRALAYPAFLLALLFVVLSILMLFVLPRFAELYRDFGAELPFLTQVLLAMVEVAPVTIPVIVAACIAIGYLVRVWLQNPSARRRYDRLKLRVPVFGPLILNRHLTQISFTFSLMLSSGMHLREAIRLVGAGVGNEDIRARLEQLGENVVAGQSLSAGLRPLHIYPELSLNLLTAGEAAGDLSRMFNDVANLHKDMLEDRLARVIALIEPAMMITVGVVLGAVIIAVYLPIFGISEVIR